MTTHLGRVVYERVQHRFTAKAIARILYSEVKDLDPLETGFFVANVLGRIVTRWITDPVSFWKFMGALLKELESNVGEVKVIEERPDAPDVAPGGEYRYRP